MGKPMTRTELIAWISETCATDKATAKHLLNELKELVIDCLKKEGEFKIPDLVQLSLKDRPARVGRNPATGEPVDIPAKTVVKARILKQLKDAVL